MFAEKPRYNYIRIALLSQVNSRFLMTNLFAAVLFKSFELGFFVAFKPVLVKGEPYFLHHCVEEIKVMHYAKPHGEHLFGFKKMPDICLGVPSAYRTVARFVDGRIVQLIFGVKKIQLARIGIYMGMAAVSCRKHAVKEINSSFHCF